MHIFIGNVKIKKTAALAPMAGVADLSHRQMCKMFGAAYVVGEMASAKGICYSDKKTAQLLRVTKQEMPMAVQLFGDDPEFMAKAAAKAAEYYPQIIDINMGCPVPKVAGNGCGSALMKNPELACQVAKAVVNAVDVPVTIKIRSGWDENSINAPEIAKMLEQTGISAITVHGRTKTQMYSGRSDMDIIKQVKDNVSIPVIGNGDIKTAQDAAEMYSKTGCDLVMVGRGSCGKPWMFSQISTYLQTGEIEPDPPLKEKIDIMLKHVQLICSNKTEQIGIKQARKHMAWYIKGIQGAAKYRNEVSNINSIQDVLRLVDKLKSEY